MKLPKIELSTQVWEDSDFAKSQMARYLFYVFYISAVSITVGYFYDVRTLWVGYTLQIALTILPILSHRQWKRKLEQKEQSEEAQLERP